jgi:branched-chain amino acid transport system permease protein
VTVQPGQLAILFVSAAAFTVLWALYRFTAFGLRVRATAVDPLGAALVGVNTDKTSATTWALAGGLAGLSAILIAPGVSFSVFFMTALLLRAVAAALVGGLTSIAGAVAAGITLGVAEGVVGYVVPIRGIVEIGIAAFVIGLLLVRPTGLVRSAY